MHTFFWYRKNPILIERGTIEISVANPGEASMLRALFYLFDGMNCTLHSNISESEIEPDGAQEFGPISPLFVDCDLYYEL